MKITLDLSLAEVAVLRSYTSVAANVQAVHTATGATLNTIGAVCQKLQSALKQDTNETYCPSCGTLLMQVRVGKDLVAPDQCRNCGHII